MTRRNIRKRIHDLDGEGTAREWPEAVEIAGVSATEVDEDGRPVEDDGGGEDGVNAEGDDRDDRDGDEAVDDEEFTIIIPIPPNDEAGEVKTTATGDCPTEGCPNTVAGPLDTCEACTDIPSRDWREETCDPEAVNHE